MALEIYNHVHADHPRVTRRGFIKAAAMALAGGAVLAVIDKGFGIPLFPLKPELTRSAFARHTGEIFEVHPGSAQVVALQLAEVRSLAVSSSSAANTDVVAEDCFSLLFRSTSTPLKQGTYPLEHAWMGSFPLFIVPMASQPGTHYYEAIFNCPRI